MLRTVTPDSIALNFFSQPISDDKNLYFLLQVAIDILRTQWVSIAEHQQSDYGSDTNFIYYVNLQEQGQEKFVKSLASHIFYLEQAVTWEKKCSGHEFFVTSTLRNKRDQNDLIRKKSAIYCSNPDVILSKTKGELVQKKNNKYLAKFTLFHKDNAPSCPCLPQEVYSEPQITPLDTIFEKLDVKIATHNLTSKKEYAALFFLITNIDL